jgi:hypothetical protein
VGVGVKQQGGVGEGTGWTWVCSSEGCDDEALIQDGRVLGGDTCSRQPEQGLMVTV